MPRRIAKSDNAPKPAGPYSQGVAAGDFVFVSAIDGREPATGKRPEGIEAQTRQALSNVSAVLKAAGTSLDNAVKVSVLLSDLKDFESMNKVYAEFLPKDQPARTTIQTAFRGDTLVAIDAIAVLPGH